MFNSAGVVVKQAELINEYTAHVQTDDLETGIYFVTINIDNLPVKVEKLLIIKP